MKRTEIEELLKIEEIRETGTRCPCCGLNTMEEQNYGFERVSFCVSCEYSKTITL